MGGLASTSCTGLPEKASRGSRFTIHLRSSEASQKHAARPTEAPKTPRTHDPGQGLSLIHISEPTRPEPI
eukprot:5924253-Pyramimonas_sp.AAC.1